MPRTFYIAADGCVFQNVPALRSASFHFPFPEMSGAPLRKQHHSFLWKVSQKSVGSAFQSAQAASTALKRTDRPMRALPASLPLLFPNRDHMQTKSNLPLLSSDIKSTAHMVPDAAAILQAALPVFPAALPTLAADCALLPAAVLFRASVDLPGCLPLAQSALQRNIPAPAQHTAVGRSALPALRLPPPTVSESVRKHPSGHSSHSASFPSPARRRISPASPDRLPRCLGWELPLPSAPALPVPDPEALMPLLLTAPAPAPIPKSSAAFRLRPQHPVHTSGLLPRCPGEAVLSMALNLLSSKKSGKAVPSPARRTGSPAGALFFEPEIPNI